MFAIEIFLNSEVDTEDKKYIGIVSRMAVRPVVVPDTFSGEGSWTDWTYLFCNVAEVNKWNDDAEKLQWLRGCIIG